MAALVGVKAEVAAPRGVLSMLRYPPGRGPQPQHCGRQQRLMSSLWIRSGSTRVRKAIDVAAHVLAAIIVIGWMLDCSGVGAIPPEAVTHGRLTNSHRALNAFGLHHGRPPNSLEELESSGFLSTPAVDGWGRRLVYTWDGKGIVRLGSWGADGRPGGEAEDADQLRQFFTWDETGSFLPHDPSVSSFDSESYDSR